MEDLHKLWGFVQVARCGSFSAAAERLGVSASALSKSVARLEEKMGIRLFMRTTRSLHLTGEGQDLFDRVSRSFSDIEESLNLVGHAGNEPSGLILLSTVTSYGRHSILPILPQFLERYPLIDLRLSFHDGGRGLTRQPFDIRITWGEEKERDKVEKLLCKMPLILVASPRYLAHRGLPKAPQDLYQHECISVALPGLDRPHWIFSLRRALPDSEPYVLYPKGRVVVMDELDVVSDAAVAGLGITLISAQNVLTQLRDGSLIRLLPQYDVKGHSDKQVEIVMQYPQRKHLSARAGLLVDYLLEKLREKNDAQAFGIDVAPD